LNTVLASGKPLVIDADALNLLAESGAPAREDWILTPHPGEAGRLLGLSAQEIQRDRLAALDRLLDRFHGTIVLKAPAHWLEASAARPGCASRAIPACYRRHRRCAHRCDRRHSRPVPRPLDGGACRGAGARHGRRRRGPQAANAGCWRAIWRRAA